MSHSIEAGDQATVRGSDGRRSKPEAHGFVGIGASAGGVEALKQLFAGLSADSGLALVVIQHLGSDRPSMLRSVLEGATSLRVVEAEDGMRAEPNRVHVIPHDADLTLRAGVIRLRPRQLTGRLHLPVDTFFRSLAEDQADRAIGVVLSGAGADGSEGLRAIHAEGGIAIAQEPASATARSMPESAIAAGVVDFVGTPEAIAAELYRLGRHPYVATSSPSASVEPGAEPDAPPEPERARSLAVVLALLRTEAGVDFRGYKHTTVLRRIERRMALKRAATLEDYAGVLEEDPAEARALAQDMLVHVTGFFRDPESFDALQEEVFTDLVERKAGSGSIRVWVPGCSTGEEAYSLAICLLESLGPAAQSYTIKLFGTDLSAGAITRARAGTYSEAALAGVSPERLAEHFERVEGGFRIAKRVRDLCVFVKHDLVRDPPFAKLDLISCRNVLIYFEPELQRRVIPMLHYCLNAQGHLFLGRSETLGAYRDLFAPLDDGHRLFVKSGESARFAGPWLTPDEDEGTLPLGAHAARPHSAREAQRQADHLLLSRYAPPGVVVNEHLKVVQFRGRTGAFLEQPPGLPQADLLRMAREDLLVHLHEALDRAREQSTPVRKAGLRIRAGSERRTIDLEVVPLAPADGSSEHHFLVLFDESPASHRKRERHLPRWGPTEHPDESASEIERLRSELSSTKDYLQALVSEQQATASELGATNEEVVAANEELQSANEELQSAQEELQSTNEELTTVNDQLQHRNQELDQVASDLVNVLASVEIPVVIVDRDLRVRRFTPAASDIASFIPSDVGRPIDDLKLRIQVPDLASRIQEVLAGRTSADLRVQAQGGRWFQMQIRPYRAADQRLDGAVLSFVDVDALEQARRQAEEARDYARSIVETVTTALIVLDSDLRVISANAAFCRAFRLPPESAVGRALSEVAPSLWDGAVVKRALEGSVSELSQFTHLEVALALPAAGQRILSLTGRPLPWGHGTTAVLLALDDVTDLRELESERALLLASEKQARLEAERANHAKDLFLATLSHELRTPLSTMLMSAQLLQRTTGQDHKTQRVAASIERAALTQARLVNDLLDVSRIISGKLLLDLGPVDIDTIVESTVEATRPSAAAKALELELVVNGPIGAVYGDEVRLQQVVSNLLDNAVKFTPHGGHIQVRMVRADELAELIVTDTGVGIRPEVLPQLFNRFVQADSTVTRTYGGLGLGLSIVRHIVEAHGGSVQAESAGEGRGSTFRVSLPLGNGAAAGAAGKPRVAVRGIEGVRVLLVEDDDDTRESCAAMLAELGAEVRAEASAAAGLAALESFRPHVILSDIAMPGEDGYSFMEQVRRLPPDRGGRTPAAALTALAGDQDRDRARLAGFQIHAAKPVDSARLAAAVRLLADWEPLGSGGGGG